MHRTPTEATAVVAAHRQTHDRLVEIVRRHAGRGDTERVLRSATLAASHAWWGPTGLLADPVLEGLVIDAVADGRPPVVDGGRRTGRVLHVLSEAYDVGGHTRLARRWISRDTGRVSSVALTNQLQAVPGDLAEVVRASGGRLHDLRAADPDLLPRARALRALFDDVDVVVLHVHPYDAVALAAVGLPGVRPPVVFENHTDHAFWLGVGVADVVSDFRSNRLTTALRGVAPERVAVLPLPIDPPVSDADPVQLRRRLGIAPDAVVAVCVATTAKVAPTWGRGMAALVDRALSWSPRLTVVMVGAAATDEWTRLVARHPGRLLVVGAVPDPDPWYLLADVYLDSYPTRAGTSVLEAALVGKPVLTIVDLPATELTHVFQSDSPGMVGRPRVGTAQQYVTALRRLVDDPELRAREGSLVQDAVRAAHCGPAWDEALEAVYARARTAGPADRPARRTTDERYAAALAAFMDPHRPVRSLTMTEAAHPLGELYDELLRSDVFAATHRDAGTLTVRVADGWEEHPGWTARLLALAGDHPRLGVSLPFVAGDDRAGSASTAVLVGLLAGIGQTPEDCGTVAVESRVPVGATLLVPEELACTEEQLDRLVTTLTSPLWSPATAEPRPLAPV